MIIKCFERQSSKCRSKENKTAQKAPFSNLLSQDCSKGSSFLAAVIVFGPASKTLIISSNLTLVNFKLISMPSGE